MSITPMPYSPPKRWVRTRNRSEGYATPAPYVETARTRRGRAAAVTTHDTEAELERRNTLIVEYLPLVKFIAGRISGRLPNHVEMDDLIESGIIGLIDALEKFDPSHQIKFKTYAEFRIRGAILDELRALDWVPRSTRQKATRLERAYSELEQRLGKPASDAEMIEFLNISPQEFDELIREARGTALLSLDELRGDGEQGSESHFMNATATQETQSATQSLGAYESCRMVADTIDKLPEKERLVISLYYYEELTMKEIGEIMNVTESRVSQIHTKAVLRLRGRMLKAVED